MRFLIDGYNLMHAGGLLSKRQGSAAFRRVRNRFLNDLADGLGALDAHRTTVVFDAAMAPERVPRMDSRQGISVVFAVENQTADDRIAEILRKDSNPKTLTVVSTDRGVREAASRRRATAVTSEDFWIDLDARKERRASASRRRGPSLPEAPRDRGIPLASTEENAHWLRTFGHLDELPEVREALAPDSGMLTDADIARIAREVDREFD